jgi:hypothetical protein
MDSILLKMKDVILNFFQANKKMRYLIPFGIVDDILEYFKRPIKENLETDSVVLIVDDGEKFGMWLTA